MVVNVRNVLFVFLLLIPILAVSAVDYDAVNNPNFNFDSFNYDPVPVSPGSQFDIWFKLRNVGNQPTQNAYSILELNYPFYLDASENATKNFGATGQDEDLIILYRVRVREDAVEGNYNLTLKYSARAAVEETTVQVKIAKVNTDFDIAVQSYSDGELSIAISNIGQNGASAVTVSGFEGYKAIIGNIDAGDYTVISIPVTSEWVLNETGNKEIQLQVSYTDLNGNRRSVNKVAFLVAAQIAASEPVNAKTDNGNSIWFYTTIFLLLVILGKLAYKFAKRRHVVK